MGRQWEHFPAVDVQRAVQWEQEARGAPGSPTTSVTKKLGRREAGVYFSTGGERRSAALGKQADL